MEMTESEKALYLAGDGGLAPYLRQKDKGMPKGKVDQIAWLLLNGGGCGFCKVCRDEPCGIKDGERCTENIANYIRECVRGEDCNSALQSCKVQPGDVVWRIDTDEEIPLKIESFRITSAEISEGGAVLLKHDGEAICELENVQTSKPYLDYYRCFSQEAEANAFFEELKRNRGL